MERTNQNYMQQDGNWAEQSKCIKLQLKPHQYRSVYEMMQLEKSDRMYTSGRNFGMLANQVGSGKSLCVLSLIALQKNVSINPQKYTQLYTKEDENFRLKAQYSGFSYNQDLEIKSNLIVVPHSIYKQWLNYIRNQTDLKCFSVGSIADVRCLNKMTLKEKIDYLGQYDCVLLKATKWTDFAASLEIPKKYRDNLIENNSNNGRSCFKSISFTSEHTRGSNKISEYFTKLEEMLWIMLQIDQEHMANRFKQISYVQHAMQHLKWNCSQQRVEQYIDLLNQLLINVSDTDTSKFNAYLQKAVIDSPQAAVLNLTKNMNALIDAIENTKYIREYVKNEQLQHHKHHYFVDNFRHYEMPIFQRVIIDEADSIKIDNGNQLCGKIQWFVTSTYRNIYLGDFGCTYPEAYIDRVILRNDPDFIKQSLNIPEYIERKITCRGQQDAEILAGCGPIEIVKAIHAGDIKTAINAVGCQIVTELGDISKAVLHNMKAKIEDNNKKIEKAITQQQILEIEEQQRTIRKNMDQLENRLSNIDKNDCPVCMDAMSFISNVPCCRASFCFGCITKTVAMNGKCPMCRAPLEMSQIIVMSDQQDKQEDQVQYRTKLEELYDLIIADGKFLIFSSYDGTFDQIQEFLIEKGISHGQIKGNSNVIEKTLQRFKQGDLKVLMLNASNFGAGINLETATDIVIYHGMDPQLEIQVIGRGQRPGRTQPLKVTKLLNRYEEYEDLY